MQRSVPRTPSANLCQICAIFGHKKISLHQQVERSLVPIALTPAGLGPVKPQVVHPRLALPNLIWCQTSLNSLIYGANLGNDERGTDSLWNELQDDEPGELSLLTVAGNGHQDYCP